MKPSEVSRRRRICVLSPSIVGKPAGAVSVAAWIVQALCEDFDVTLATPAQDAALVDLDYLYGTSLAEQSVGLLRIPVPRWLNRLSPSALKSIRLAHAVRAFRPLAHAFDLTIAAVNEVQIPAPNIQYMHCPVRHPQAIRRLYSPPASWCRLANHYIFRSIMPGGVGRTDCNARYLANSGWTATLFLEVYGLRPKVVYPPVVLAPGVPSLPFSQREPAFVCVGQFRADKAFEEAIALVDELRSRYQHMCLHIVGNGSGSYASHLRRLARVRKHVIVHESMSRRELTRLLCSSRYGLHFRRNEHFGMAPAEMVAAGMLTFVHNSGGQREIVGHRGELLFEDVRDALTKVTNMLEHPERQEAVLDALKPLALRLGAARFQAEIREEVSDMLGDVINIPGHRERLDGPAA